MVSLIIHYLLIIISFASQHTVVPEPACHPKCGTLEVKYPLGTGHGCGSPRFHPYVSCSPDGNHLLLTTHTGSYPITSISYSSSTITITPPCMSNCTYMQPSPTNFGLDWTSPFQLGTSTFILLSCTSPTSSLTMKGSTICDPSTTYLCASIYTCPGVTALGLPLFPPTNTCCVYSPANLDTKDELDLHAMKCAGYASVVSLGDVPTDPAQWQYGVELKYTLGGLDSYNIAPSCHACEFSGGICGYAPPRNSFVCVCPNGVNTTIDCHVYSQGQWITAGSPSQSIWKFAWLGILAVLSFSVAAH